MKNIELRAFVYQLPTTHEVRRFRGGFWKRTNKDGIVEVFALTKNGLLYRRHKEPHTSRGWVGYEKLTWVRDDRPYTLLTRPKDPAAGCLF